MGRLLTLSALRNRLLFRWEGLAQGCSGTSFHGPVDSENTRLPLAQCHAEMLLPEGKRSAFHDLSNSLFCFGESR